MKLRLLLIALLLLANGLLLVGCGDTGDQTPAPRSMTNAPATNAPAAK